MDMGGVADGIRTRNDQDHNLELYRIELPPQRKWRDSNPQPRVHRDDGLASRCITVLPHFPKLLVPVRDLHLRCPPRIRTNNRRLNRAQLYRLERRGKG